MDKELATGAIFCLCGLTFLLSYFFEEHFPPCRVVMAVCRYLTVPPRRWMALVYAGILLFIGILFVLMGIGYLDSSSLRFDK